MTLWSYPDSSNDDVILRFCEANLTGFIGLKDSTVYLLYEANEKRLSFWKEKTWLGHAINEQRKDRTKNQTSIRLEPIKLGQKNEVVPRNSPI